MTRRRLRAVTVVAAFVLVPALIWSVPASAAKSGSKNQFKNLKPIKEPNPCKNDPGVTATEIKVGGLIPTTGAQAQSFGPSIDGIQARFDKANSEKEVGNHKLTFDNVDTASDPAKNLSAAQQLVEQDNVFGIISVDIAADGSGKYLNQKKIPVVGWHVGRGIWGTYTNMFPFADGFPPNPETTFSTLQADLMKKLGGTKVALVGFNNPSSVQFIQNIADEVKATPGMKTVAQIVDVAPGSSDFGAVAQKIKDSGADALYTGMDFAQNIALTGALKQAGVTMKVIVFPGGYDNRAAAVPGLDQAYFGLEFKPFEMPGNAGYAEFSKWMGDKVKNQVSAIGWMSADAFITGLKAAGTTCPTRKAFINNLRLVKNYDAGGFVDPINFADVFGKVYLCNYFVQVVNKAFVPQFDNKPLCARGVLVNGKLKKGLTAGAGPTTGIS